MALYLQFLDYKCANPQCKSGLDVEVHHILPRKNGGLDVYWNFICLCRRCHSRGHYHSRHGDHDTELFVYKTKQELETWGFVLDETQDDYYEKLKILVLNNKHK